MTLQKTNINSAFKQISYYGFASGLAVAINFFSRMLYEFWFPFSISIIFAYLTGSAAKFLISRKYVFKAGESGDTLKAFTKFIAVSFVGLFITYYCSIYTLSVLVSFKVFSSSNISHNVSHIIGICTGFTANFIGHKYYAFRDGPTVRKKNRIV